jgi:hypothetical protein
MAANPVLVGGVLLAGGFAAWAWFKSRQAQQASTTQNFCNGLCDGLTGPELAACQATCQLGSTIVGDIPDPLTCSECDWNNQVSGDAKNNDDLNGPIAVHVSTDGIGGSDPESAVTGNALLYQNGCMPFFDAPGWTACAKGTLDMYSSAVYARSPGGDYGADAATEHALVTNAGTVQPEPRGYTRDGHVEVVKINKNKFLTGEPGDPTTKGPFGAGGSGLEMYIVQTSDGASDPNADDAAIPPDAHPTLRQYVNDAAPPDSLTWYSRGTRITCPAGQVPKSVLLGANGEPNPDPIGTETCVSAIGGANLCNGTQPPAGFTWNRTGGVWVRATPGQPIDPGPCDPNFGACVGPSCINQTRAGGGINSLGGTTSASSSSGSASSTTRSTSIGTRSTSSTVNSTSLAFGRVPSFLGGFT